MSYLFWGDIPYKYVGQNPKRKDIQGPGRALWGIPAIQQNMDLKYTPSNFCLLQEDPGFFEQARGRAYAGVVVEG